MLMAPTLVALCLKQAPGFDEVVFPTVLTGTFELMQRGRRGVSLCSRAPTVIRGALQGD